MTAEVSPQQALAPRVVFVAESAFIAGHLTRRFGCDGELQWLNVAPEGRRKGIASDLLRQLAQWFVERDAKRICVDVDPENAPGRAFYLRHGAAPLNPHWLLWNDIARVVQ